MEKITKAQARKLYESGKTIYLNPSKMRLNSVWHQAAECSKAILDNEISDAPSFDSLVNSYSYYNCTKETGLVVHYYKK